MNVEHEGEAEKQEQEKRDPIELREEAYDRLRKSIENKNLMPSRLLQAIATITDHTLEIGKTYAEVEPELPQLLRDDYTFGLKALSQLNPSSDAEYDMMPALAAHFSRGIIANEQRMVKNLQKKARKALKQNK